MRVWLPYFGLSVLTLILLVVLVGMLVRGYHAYRARRRERIIRDTQWRAYQRPDRLGQIETGVERAWKDLVIESHTLGGKLSGDSSDLEMLLAFEQAEERASLWNRTRRT